MDLQRLVYAFSCRVTAALCPYKVSALDNRCRGVPPHAPTSSVAYLTRLLDNP